MSILKQLLDNNELYCYYDFRSGTYLDYTGNTTLTGTADTSLVKGKLIIPHTKRLTIGSLAIGTNDFSIVSKTRPQSYSKHILGATNFNLTVYSEFDLSTFFGGSTYYNSANQSKLDRLRWNQIGATYNRDGNVTYYENGLSFRTIDISGTSAVDKTDTYYLGYTNTGYIEYSYFLIVKRVLTATEMAQLTAELESKKWTSKTKSRANAKNVLVDGDMKALGTSAWSSGSSAILSKVIDTTEGKGRILRVTKNVTNYPYAYQNCLEVGKTYRMTGYVRGDGTGSVPKIYDNLTQIFSGTNSANWKRVDIVFTSGSTEVRFRNPMIVGDYVDFANIQISEVGSDEVIYKTENGIRADQKTYSTAGQPINSTDLILNGGSVKIVDGVYNGEKVKILESTITSNCSIPVNKLKQTPTESAYGEWEFIMSAPDAKFNIIKFISSTTDTASTSGDNYNISMRPSSGSNIIQIRVNNSNLVQWGSYFTDNQFYKIKVTRTGAGLFSLFIDDVLIGTATNTTYTSSNYFVFSMETGSKIILSSERGTYGIIKK